VSAVSNGLRGVWLGPLQRALPAIERLLGYDPTPLLTADVRAALAEGTKERT
jgi:hypothetical protein